MERQSQGRDSQVVAAYIFPINILGLFSPDILNKSEHKHLSKNGRMPSLYRMFFLLFLVMSGRDDVRKLWPLMLLNSDTS